MTTPLCAHESAPKEDAPKEDAPSRKRKADESAPKEVASNCKKQKVEGGEHSLSLEERLSNLGVLIYFQSNDSLDTIDEMIENVKSRELKFPPGLETYIKSLGVPKGGVPKEHDCEVVILGNESDQWKVRLTFLDWVFTLIIKKDNLIKKATKEGEHLTEGEVVQFATPCSYQGYSLSIKEDKFTEQYVQFPTFFRPDVAWSEARFPDTSGFPYISIYLDTKVTDDDCDDPCIGMIHVHLDKVFKTLIESTLCIM